MTINILSDIHCGKKLPPHFDIDALQKTGVLVIAGDLATADTYSKILKIFKSYEGKLYDHLVLVRGNHDYYTKKYYGRYGLYQSDDTKKAFVPHPKHNHIDIIDKVAFVCSTMWTPIDKDRFAIERCMNDYNYIPYFTTSQCTKLFEINCNWIIDNVKKYKDMGYKVVVVTHHGPTGECIDKRYEYNNLNEAYFCMDKTDSDRLLDSNPDIWIYGHTHTFDDRIIKNTRLIRNPVGYDYDHNYNYNDEYLYTGFKLNYIVEI